MNFTIKKAGLRQGELHRSIQAGGVGAVACQRPQCGEGSSGAWDSSSTAVPLGALGAPVQRSQERAKL